MNKKLGMLVLLISCGGLILAKKAEVKPRVNDITTEALSAARDKKWELVQELVLKGADVNGLDMQGDSLLSYAIFFLKPDAVEFLLERGALANRVGGPRLGNKTLLYYVVAQSQNFYAPSVAFSPTNLKIAELLVDRGADIKAAVGDISPLEKAIAMGNVEMVALFTKNLPSLEKMNARARTRFNNLKARATHQQRIPVAKYAE